MAKVSVAEMKGRRLGRILTKLGKVTREQVHEALQIQQTDKKPVGEILVGLGYVTEEDVRIAVAGQVGLELISLADREISEETIKAIPAATANAYQIVPVKYDASAHSIAVAVKSADNFSAIDDLRNLLGFKRVKAVLAPAEEIEEVLKELTPAARSLVTGTNHRMVLEKDGTRHIFTENGSVIINGVVMKGKLPEGCSIEDRMPHIKGSKRMT